MFADAPIPITANFGIWRHGSRGFLHLCSQLLLSRELMDPSVWQKLHIFRSNWQQGGTCIPNRHIDQRMHVINVYIYIHIYTHTCMYTHGHAHSIHMQQSHKHDQQPHPTSLSCWAGWMSVSGSCIYRHINTRWIPPAAGLKHSVWWVAVPEPQHFTLKTALFIHSSILLHLFLSKRFRSFPFPTSGFSQKHSIVSPV